MEIQGIASRRLTLETKTNKTLCAGAKGLGPLWGEGLREAKPLPALTPQRADPPPSDLGPDTKENLKNTLAR